MGLNTGISFCTATWNVTIGCTRRSAGCDNCWAIRLTCRMAQNPHETMQLNYGGLVEETGIGLDWTGTVRCLEERLPEPASWRKPQTIFVCSQSDLFHQAVPFAFIGRVYGEMYQHPEHTFLIVTKRPERALEFYQGVLPDLLRIWAAPHKAPLYLPNVWFLFTAENQQMFDRRIGYASQIPAAVHGCSFEPLLGPIDIEEARLDWAIVGAESGPRRRSMSEDWVRAIRDQCKAAGVAFYLKQAYRDGKLVEGPELDGVRHQMFPGPCPCKEAADAR